MFVWEGGFWRGYFRSCVTKGLGVLCVWCDLWDIPILGVGLLIELPLLFCSRLSSVWWIGGLRDELWAKFGGDITTLKFTVVEGGSYILDFRIDIKIPREYFLR